MNKPIKETIVRQKFQGGEFQSIIEAKLRAWKNLHLARRLKNNDNSIWKKEFPAENKGRLGWLALPEIMSEKAGGLLSFAEEAVSDGINRVVLLGMGGSSLAAETVQQIFGNKPGFPFLSILDSTHPAAVLALEKELDVARTLFLVSSQTGTTIETLSFFRYFWDRTKCALKTRGRHFAAITESGTPLEQLARERRFRRVFIAPSDVGGRYSALTEFGLIPAALIGLDIRLFLNRARLASEGDVFGVPEDESSSFLLGAALGEIASSKDKLTILACPRLQAFPHWLEQLVAESTGKNGKGIIPIVDEPMMPAFFYAKDRIFVDIALQRDAFPSRQAFLDSLEAAGHTIIRICLQEPLDVAEEIFRWESAVALAGEVLGVYPFDQPDVDLSKKLALKAMKEASPKDVRPEDTRQKISVDNNKSLKEALDGLLSQSRPGDYFSLQAYLAPSVETSQAVAAVRLALLKKSGLATTFGYGPRFLHSTGQLHKGGPNKGLFLQLIDNPEIDAAVPETDFSFGDLIRAQADGDFSALRSRGRRVLQINLHQDAGIGLARILEALRS